MTRLLFLGAGNMAEAIAQGLARVEHPFLCRATDLHAVRLELFQSRYGILGSQDVSQEVAQADVVILAVKPQQAMEVLAAVASVWNPSKLLVSICAGLRTAKLEGVLGGSSTKVVRAMPNTPCLVGLGASAICAGAAASEKDMEIAEKILGSAGIAIRVPESHMDAVTAVSGSGPAYAFFLAEAMQNAAERMGLNPQQASRLIAQTLEGAGRMLTQTGLTAGELRERVTSKGGTTAAALAVFEEHSLLSILVKALEAAARRSRELAE